MDIFRFINSKDIREHLRGLDYRFSSLEAAWLIYQCRTATLEEKHAAWRELIGTMPDCAVKKRPNCDPRDSLHGFLCDLMEMQTEFMERFRRPDPGWVYHLESGTELLESKGLPHRFAASALFSTAENCMEYIRSEYGGEEDQDSYRDFRVRKVRLDHRGKFSGNDQYIETVMRPDGSFMDLEIADALMSEAQSRIDGKGFDGLWFDFPVPFRKGDIIWDPEDGEIDGLCGGPFVMNSIGIDRFSSMKRREYILEHGDNTDMNADGWFVSDGGVYWEVMWNYMDCEYYTKELTGSAKLLKPFSSFLKDEIDPGLFARAYHHILDEYRAECSFPSDYTQEGLELAGLKK